MHFAVPFGFSRVFQVRVLIYNMAPFIYQEDTRAHFIPVFLNASSFVSISSYARAARYLTSCYSKMQFMNYFNNETS